MKKVYHSISKGLSPVKLYLDDIKKILSILKEESFSNIEIETTNNQYSEDEIDSIQPSESLSQISSYNPFYINISFYSGYGGAVRIFAKVDTALAYGVINKIEFLLKSRRRRVFSIATNIWFASLFPFLGILTTFIFLLQERNTINLIISLSLLIGTLLIFLVLMSLDSGKLCRKNIINLKKKKEQLNFWKRNEDQIISGIIVAIITSFLSVIITLIITKQ